VTLLMYIGTSSLVVFREVCRHGEIIQPSIQSRREREGRSLEQSLECTSNKCEADIRLVRASRGGIKSSQDFLPLSFSSKGAVLLASP
jgi:hypothetical protein